jgi:hypothetical protein
MLGLNADADADADAPPTESDLISGGRIDQAAVRVGGPVVMTWPSGSRSVSARWSPSSMAQPLS